MTLRHGLSKGKGDDLLGHSCISAQGSTCDRLGRQRERTIGGRTRCEDNISQQPRLKSFSLSTKPHSSLGFSCICILAHLQRYINKQTIKAPTFPLILFTLSKRNRLSASCISLPRHSRSWLTIPFSPIGQCHPLHSKYHHASSIGDLHVVCERHVWMTPMGLYWSLRLAYVT